MSLQILVGLLVDDVPLAVLILHISHRHGDIIIKHSEQALSLQILVGLLVDDVPLAVLILLLVVRLPGLVELLHLQLLPERHGVLYLGDVGEMRRVGNTKTSHAMSVSPLSKMSLERL